MTKQNIILVVDDSPQNIQVITSLLRDRYRLKAATNGQKALALANAADGRPDLILLDVVMPGMDGYEVCARLKGSPSTDDIPIVFLTSLTEAHDEAEGFRRGAVDYIHKPFNPIVVAARIEAALDRKRLRDLEKLYRANIERELDLARQIQCSILPKAFPPMSRASGHGLMVPAREVGGDFFDFIPIDEHRVGIAIGDVSDKGVAAAFFMGIARTQLRATARFDPSPGASLVRLNDMLAAENEQGMFVTVFYGILDTSTGDFTYANGGHPSPALIRAGGAATWLPGTGGMLIGMMAGNGYLEGRVRLDPGDFLFIYSDGVVEALNAEGVEFADQRLQRVLEEHGGLPVRKATEAVLEAVTAFAQGVPQADDITCVGIRYLGL